MKNGHICYPLTVSDNYSRFLLGCKALEGPRYEPTRKCMESIFREYGLPDAIRSDNGIPFAGKSIGGLSRLMIWWILLGIIPERIRKGCPQENGRHERMHRTLKSDVLNPVAGNLENNRKLLIFTGMIITMSDRTNHSMIRHQVIITKSRTGNTWNIRIGRIMITITWFARFVTVEKLNLWAECS